MAVIEIDDAGGTKAPVYMVEIIDEEKPKGADLLDVVFMCDYSDIEEVDL